MIQIRPIRAEEIRPAKYVMLKVAYGIFGWDGGTLEDSLQYFETSDEFKDMDNFQAEYFDRDGLFLVILDGATVIGSGAVRKIDQDTAELKRMWLLEDYHGQGIGYRVIQKLFEFSREKGYQQIHLQTSPEQTRAIDFYHQVGFREIASYNEEEGEVSMTIRLDGTTLPSGASPA
jgi:putative acetyltransferase